ncbi:MAG: peptidoglycan DD-metalloendopeptidase family protein [Bacteroidota bacterium]
MKKRLPEIILFTLAVVLLGIIVSRPVGVVDEEIEEPVQEKNIVEKDSMYGIVVDSLDVEHYIVENHQNVSEILSNFNVSMKTIDRLAKKSKEVFDVRKIRAGNSYVAMTEKDSLNTIQYFVYEKNATDYVVYDLRDSVEIYSGTKEVKTELKETGGEINRSLWLSMKNSGADPFLAVKLSEVYAWVVDFYAIEKGDQYKVIYEELHVDGEPVGLGRIQAAWFDHGGQPYYAFYFVQDTVGDYFDLEANSLRRTFLKAPLRYSRISSRYSNSRMHPVLRVRRPHHGVDYAAPKGTPVEAIGDGKVIKANYSGGAGNYVKIRHNSTYTTGYMHLSRYGEGIKVGKRVKQGDVIGYVGSTGLSTGPHLDFRFWRNGDPIDPLKVESPPAEPVDSSNLKRYNKHINQWKEKLDDITIESEPVKDPI